MAFARGEDSRLASSYDTCRLGYAYPVPAGASSPREEETCADALVHRRAPRPPVTALRGARESNALMPAVQSLCNGQPRKTRREV
jgi:hypothetical protein